MPDEIAPPVQRDRKPLRPAAAIPASEMDRRQAENTARHLAAEAEKAHRAAQREGKIPLHDENGNDIPPPATPTVEEILAGKADGPDPAKQVPDQPDPDLVNRQRIEAEREAAKLAEEKAEAEREVALNPDTPVEAVEAELARAALAEQARIEKAHDATPSPAPAPEGQ